MKAPPPYEFAYSGVTATPGANVPSALWSYRGRPTIFGQPECDDAGVCVKRGVIQYDPSADEWSTMDSLVNARQVHEVVEVPQAFCQLGQAPPVTTPVTPLPTDATEDTTTEEPWTTTESPIGADRFDHNFVYCLSLPLLYHVSILKSEGLQCWLFTFTLVSI